MEKNMTIDALLRQKGAIKRKEVPQSKKIQVSREHSKKGDEEGKTARPKGLGT